MQIKSVILNNIRSYINQEITFYKGSTLLSGDIGSGKTTILLAIEFCLFGMRRDLSGNTLLRNGSNEGSVELHFEVGEKNITIKRTLKRYKDGVKQTSGYIITNNMRSDLTAQEIKARVLQYIGYPQTLLTKSKNLMFRYTVYTQQEDMKQILLDDKDNRIDTLRKIFGIDKYKNIRENSLVYIKNIKEKRTYLEGRIEDLDNKITKKKVKQEQLNNLNIKIETTKQKLEQLNFDNIKQQFLETESKLNKFKQLQNQTNIFNTKIQEKKQNQEQLIQDTARLRLEIESIKEDISKKKLEKPTDKSLEELKNIISGKQEMYNETNKNKNVLNEKLNHIKMRIIELNKELEEKSEKVKDFKFKKERLQQIEQDLEAKTKIKTSITDLTDKMNIINMKLKEFQVNMQNSTNLKKHIADLNKCPTCLQPVSIDHKFNVNQKEAAKISKLNILIQRYNKERESRLKELENLNKRFEEILNKEKISSQLLSEVKNLEETSIEIEKKQKISTNFSQELQKINQEIQEINKINLKQINHEIIQHKELVDKINDYNIKLKEKKYLEEQLNDKNKTLEEIENKKQILNKEVQQISQEIKSLGTELEQYKDIEELYVKEKEKYEQLLEEQKKILIEKTSIEKEHEVISKQLQELNTEIEQKVLDKKKIKHYNQLQHWLEGYFIKLMTIIEKNVMFSTYQQFDDIFKEWFNVLMEDETINVRLDEEFTPIIEQNGYDTDYNNLSGGERTSVALAYRLALNKVVNQVQSQIKTKDLLILDEPTDGFSTEQLDKVREVLDELDLGQVIIVSHESKIESFVENVVRVEKSEHVSQVIT